MRIITLNANGIRSASRKGFFQWFERQDADVLCLQETKAQRSQLGPEITDLAGYQSFFHDAVKPGYSGVAIYTRRAPDKVHAGLGWEDLDREGRYLQVDTGKLSIVSLYLPSGTSGEERQAYKFDLMERLLPELRRMRRRRREYVICGDVNIAHKMIDIENWRSNQKNSGFLPEEREWLTRVLEELKFVDAFRAVNQQPREYTWWSNRGRAREKNVGWRIDYQLVTPGLRDAVRRASVYREERFSDHAPLTIDYDLTGRGLIP